ncbi:MAG: sigma factor-like helix-turn-helix DNA-binding protein [Acholeplasma sp.]|nr:sigma factor-like helix-turn-helix DNA-binding protein [Acholeplasma sp.]
MKTLEKAEQLNELFLTYKRLFTEKQIEYFNMYYELDYSYQEIAESFNVSRNAIFDQLKKVEDSLYEYEDKLHLVKNRKKRSELINNYLDSKNDKYLEELKRMDE